MDIKIELGRANDIDELEQLYNDLNDYLAKGINFIHTFVVHPNFWKCGIGNALISFSMKHGIESQVKSIRLDVYAEICLP